MPRHDDIRRIKVFMFTIPGDDVSQDRVTSFINAPEVLTIRTLLT